MNLDRSVSNSNQCSCLCHRFSDHDWQRTASSNVTFEQTRNDNSPPNSVSLEETQNTVSRFTALQISNDHQSLITSLDWDVFGESLLICCLDSSVGLYSLARGSVRHLYSRKYGAQCGRFLRGGQTNCIVASRTSPASYSATTVSGILASLEKIPWSELHIYNNIRQQEDAHNIIKSTSPLSPSATHDLTSSSRVATPTNSANTTIVGSALRHWDLQENRFVKTFPLPAPVIPDESLSVSQPPTNFIAASCQDATVRIFTLDREKPLASIISRVGSPLSCLSLCGSVGAIQILPFVIQVFDFRMGWHNSDYLAIDLEAAVPLEKLLGIEASLHSPRCYAELFKVTNLLISPNSSSIFITLTNTGTFRTSILQFNICTGGLIYVYQDEPLATPAAPPVEKWKLNFDKGYEIPFHFIPSISMDGEFLACGTMDQNIHIWSVEKHEPSPVKTLQCHTGLPKFLGWNPTDMSLVSAFDHVIFWGAE